MLCDKDLQWRLWTCIDVHGNYLSREIGTALIMNAMNGYTVIDHSLEIMEEAYTALTHLTNPERTLLPQWQLPAYIKP